MEGVGLIAAIIFFVVFIAAAFVVFSMVRRTVKLALRLLIIGVLLLVAFAGAVSLWWFSGSSGNTKERPANVRRVR